MQDSRVPRLEAQMFRVAEAAMELRVDSFPSPCSLPNFIYSEFTSRPKSRSLDGSIAARNHSRV